MVKQKMLIWIVFSLLLVIIFVSGCSQYIPIDKDDSNIIKKDENIKDQSLPTTFTEIDLKLSKAPLLGETVLLNATVSIIQEDVVNVKFNIDLPFGFEFVSGDLYWEGDIMIPNKTLPPFNETNPQSKTSLSLISYIKAVQEGNWTIVGTLSELNGTTLPPNLQPYAEFKPNDKLYVSISKTNSSVSEFPFPEPAEQCQDSFMDGELIQCTTTRIEVPPATTKTNASCITQVMDGMLVPCPDQ